MVCCLHCKVSPAYLAATFEFVIKFIWLRLWVYNWVNQWVYHWSLLQLLDLSYIYSILFLQYIHFINFPRLTSSFETKAYTYWKISFLPSKFCFTSFFRVTWDLSRLFAVVSSFLKVSSSITGPVVQQIKTMSDSCLRSLSKWSLWWVWNIIIITMIFIILRALYF